MLAIHICIFGILLPGVLLSKCNHKISHDYKACDVVDKMRTEKCARNTSIDDSIRGPIGNSNITNLQPKNHACGDEIVLETIDIYPFNLLIKDYILAISKICCGPCVDIENIQLVNTPSNLTKLMNEKDDFRLDADIIYPVLGKKDAAYVLGLKFIPLLSVDKMALIELQKSKSEVMKELVSACIGLWPLLTICLLLAFLAGFFGWILDTWKNEEEFPRPFLSGVYEGFWWSFVSMTTVGYGDKAPKSVMARLFSVGWIMIGITICSMFTASLTTAITEAAAVQEPSMRGKEPTYQIESVNGFKVGVLSNRLVDAAFVVKNGGKPRVYENMNVMVDDLQNGDISMIVVDAMTFQFFLEKSMDLSKYNTVIKDFSEDKMSYGMLILNDDLVDMFSQFMTENGLALQTCINGENIREKNILSSEIDIFATSSGLFWPFFGASMSFIALMMMMGFIFEYFQRKIAVQRKDLAAKDGGREDEELMNTLQLLFEKLNDKNSSHMFQEVKV